VFDKQLGISIPTFVFVKYSRRGSTSNTTTMQMQRSVWQDEDEEPLDGTNLYYYVHDKR